MTNNTIETAQALKLLEELLQFRSAKEIIPPLQQVDLLIELNALGSPADTTMELKRQIARKKFETDPIFQIAAHRLEETRSSISNDFKILYFNTDLRKTDLEAMDQDERRATVIPLFKKTYGIDLDAFEDLVQQPEPELQIKYDFIQPQGRGYFSLGLIYPTKGYKNILAVIDVAKSANPLSARTKYGKHNADTSPAVVA